MHLRGVEVQRDSCCVQSVGDTAGVAGLGVATVIELRTAKTADLRE